MPREQINFPSTGKEPAIHISWTLADKKNDIPGWAQIAFDLAPQQLVKLLAERNTYGSNVKIYSPALTRAELLALAKAARRAARHVE